jgi:hypothetical protein
VALIAPRLDAPGATRPARADDPGARMLLHRAQGALQKWPEGFAGFRARVTVGRDGHECSGWVTVRPGPAIEVDLGDCAERDWARELLEAIAAERTPRFFKDGDGRHAISFGPEDADPAGRPVLVHRGADGTASLRFRIDAAGRLRRREEHDPDGRHVHTAYEAYMRATPGRVLPIRVATMAYEADHILRSEVAEDTHCLVRHAWLPSGRRVQLSQVHGATIRWTRLAEHVLL